MLRYLKRLKDRIKRRTTGLPKKTSLTGEWPTSTTTCTACRWRCTIWRTAIGRWC